MTLIVLLHLKGTISFLLQYPNKLGLNLSSLREKVSFNWRIKKSLHLKGVQTFPVSAPPFLLSAENSAALGESIPSTDYTEIIKIVNSRVFAEIDEYNKAHI